MNIKNYVMGALCLLTALIKRMKGKRQKEVKKRLRRKRQKLRKEDPFELPELEFRRLYRFSKPLCREIVDEVAPFLKPPKRRTAISQDRKVLAALRFFAVGNPREFKKIYSIFNHFSTIYNYS